jgi:AcrR family transcriptional regulator
MTRVVKKPDIRKNEILGAAQDFFFNKGYESTTIQDILDRLSIAKGTFYYYFSSKDELLDALVERTTDQTVAQFAGVMDSEQNAIKKFNSAMRAASAFKRTNIAVFAVFLEVLYRDENMLLRTRMFRGIIEKAAPLFGQIIRQGIAERLFNTSDPDEIAAMIVELGQHLNAKICELLLDTTRTPEQLCTIMERKTRLYERVIERILGAPRESIEVFIADDFRAMVQYLSGRLRGETIQEET